MFLLVIIVMVVLFLLETSRGDSLRSNGRHVMTGKQLEAHVRTSSQTLLMAMKKGSKSSDCGILGEMVDWA